MTMRWHLLLLSARPRRAILETLLVGTMMWIGLLLLHQQVPSFILQLGISLLIGPSCMLLCALRLQILSGSWQRQGVIDVTFAALSGLVLSSMTLVYILVLLQSGTENPLWRGTYRPYLLATIALGLDIAVFVITRIGVRLWLFWNQLRRKQLLWSLTHAHILVMAVGVGLLVVVLEILAIQNSFGFLVVPTTLGLLLVGGIALAVVIPPSALFSYLVVRRTTQRLKILMAATGTLRKGDYTVRLLVEGEDEVAQLQANFNRMAEDMERAMHDLQAERDTVSALLQARRELIANVSHELRTPVATLRGYLETTLNHWDESIESTLLHDLQIMESEVIQLQGLVDDLFTLARSEVGKLTLQCKPTNMDLLVRRVVETAAPLVWQSNKIEMVTDVPSEMPPALVDENRMEQVLRNLLHNSVRHTSPGGIVAVVVKVEPEAIVLQVKDTGEGIAAADLPRIWDRFYQAQNARTRMSHGAGLGLTLVKEWIEDMGGTVMVESVVGEGSCFTIRLPAIKA
jgi:signal transduction histidine kinase